MTISAALWEKNISGGITSHAKTLTQERIFWIIENKIPMCNDLGRKESKMKLGN